jgi:hypothetical protein
MPVSPDTGQILLWTYPEQRTRMASALLFLLQTGEFVPARVIPCLMVLSILTAKH